MREDLRRRLREISLSRSTQKNGVTGVTASVTPPQRTALHHPLHLAPTEKAQLDQRCNTVTPVTPQNSEGSFERYTVGGVTDGVTRCLRPVLQANFQHCPDLENWFAHFEERAAIREYEGGFDRAEAERLALEETIAALGPQPATIH